MNFKTTLTSIILTIFVSPALSAQTTSASYAPKFGSAQFSPSVGFIMADYEISNDGSDTKRDITPLLGFSIGIDVLIPTTSEYMDYLTGLYYSESKVRVVSTYYSTTSTEVSEARMTLKRLSLPLLAKYYPFKKSLGMYIKAGAYTHYNIEAQMQGSYQTTDLTTSSKAAAENYDYKFNHSEGLRPINADAVIGAGYQGTIGSGFGFFVEMIYQRGLLGLDISDDDVKIHTTTASFGIGF